MPGRVLLDDVLDVVRPQSLLKPALGYKVLDLAQAANRFLLRLRQLSGALDFIHVVCSTVTRNNS